MNSSWELAVSRALRAAGAYRQRWYVRGFRDPGGQWIYGVYAEPNPPSLFGPWSHLRVSDRGKLIVPPTIPGAKSVH